MGSSPLIFYLFIFTGAVLRHRRAGRVECTSTLSSCQYYSHCINANFPCGQDGFLLSYVQKRCELIDGLVLRRPGRQCNSPSCVSYNGYLWAHETDDCLKSALENLNGEFEVKGLHSDPSMCLKWEQHAVLKMDKCYRAAWEKYPLNDEDARVLTNLFRIDEYFDSVVDQGIPSLVARHTNWTNSSPLSSNRTYDRRLFCVKGSGNTPQGDDRDLSREEVITVVKKALEGQDLSSAQYHYGGMDGFYDENPCITNEPAGININVFDYHLVTLLVPTNTTVRKLSQYRTAIITRMGRFAASLYQLSVQVEEDSAYSVLRFSQCGDGIRQAGEECDYGHSGEGCTTDCRIMSGYDCTVDRMQPSICWPEVCGDGYRTRGEECDDGNRDGGDGCNSECRLETASHSCTTTYNATSTCQAGQKVQLSPKQSPSYITAKRLSAAQSKALANTKRTIQLPREASGAKSSFSSLSLTLTLTFAAIVSTTTLDLWR